MLNDRREGGYRIHRRRAAAGRVGIVSLVLLALSGCTLIENGTRTLVLEPAHFSIYKSLWWTKVRNKRLAEESLARRHPPGEESGVSEHFARGYLCGFADYLTYGGEGLPPVLPPRDYWQPKYQTPEGRVAIHEWFAGFTEGTEMAKASGLRELETVPATGAVEPPLETRSSDEPAGRGSEIWGPPERIPLPPPLDGDVQRLPPP
jgi:hypothetical protein